MARLRKKESWIGRKYSFKRMFKDLWHYAMGYRKKLVFYLIIIILVSLVSMAPTYLYGRIIDDLTVQRYDRIYLFLVLTVISHLFFQITHNFSTYKAKILAAIVGNQARIKTFNYLFNLDYEFYETQALGQLFQRISTGARNLSEFIRLLYSRALVQLFSMIFAAVFLFVINLTLGAFATIVLVLFYSYSIYAGNRLVEKENKVHHVAEKVYSKVFDFFTHIQIVKLLNIKDKLLGILDKSYIGVIDQQKISRRYERQTVAISKLILELSTVGSLFYIAVLVMDGSMTIGIAVMAFGFFTKFTRKAMALWGIYMELIGKRTGMYRMSLIYDIKPKIKEPEHPVKPEKWQEVKFSNVTFRYPSKKVAALKNVSFKVKKGEKLAIVGLSGSGKSTIAKLLLRLYLPTSGSITVGDVDIRDIHSDDLYEMIKIVPQENELINTTIYENLQMTSLRRVSREEIRKALKNAAAWDFVRKLPERMKTHVGPDGVKISGGEKQRLCIARALLTKPDIVVLDEATSNLDVRTEKKVHEALHDLSKDITLIAITHRISSVHLFDRIIVMHNGRVAGEGTHRSLLRTNRYYRKLQEVAKKEAKKAKK